MNQGSHTIQSGSIWFVRRLGVIDYTNERNKTTVNVASYYFQIHMMYELWDEKVELEYLNY